MNGESINKICAIFKEENKGLLSSKDRMAIGAIELVNPTHLITLSLNQARQIRGEYHGVTWLRGDDAIYSETHRGFIRSLSKSLQSRTSWKFHRTLLRSAGALEGGSNSVRNHLHLIIAKPDHVSEEAFRIKALRAAAGNPWIMNGDHAVDIQNFGGNREAIVAAFYNVKHGTERLTFT